jgi:hypothetical protein
MAPSMTRREFLRSSTAGSLSLASLGRAGMTPNPVAGSSERPKAGDYRIYFGDLHNHSSVGYAQGSLERAFDIAHNHLDFFAFTPHGYWHDIGHYENGIEKKWLDGFEVTKKRWPEVLERVCRYDHYHTSYRVSDTDDEEQLSWYYLRAVQANNQIAWSSPIWVEPPAQGTKV